MKEKKGEKAVLKQKTKSMISLEVHNDGTHWILDNPPTKVEVLSGLFSCRDVVFSTPENRPEKFDIVGDYLVHPPEKEAEFNLRIDAIIAETKLTSTPNRYLKSQKKNQKKNGSLASQKRLRKTWTEKAVKFSRAFPARPRWNVRACSFCSLNSKLHVTGLQGDAELSHLSVTKFPLRKKKKKNSKKNLRQSQLVFW